MRRTLLLAAALAIPIAGVTLAVAPPAFAGAKIVCTTITSTSSSTIVVSGCSGGNTGGKSMSIADAALAAGGTITWQSGSTTTISAPVLGATSAKKCPGYVKNGNPSTEPTAEKFSARVTHDSGDGIKTPGKASGAICIAYGTGDITALKDLKTS